MVKVIAVETEEEVAAVKALIYEFIDWLGARYPELEELIKDYFSNQGFDEEMSNLLGVFGPPGGACLLAYHQGEPVGILMMKPHGETEVEMNRMFVKESARGLGIGKALAVRLVEEARRIGYDWMILSALDRHFEALPLYRGLGFVDDSERPPDSGDEREIRLKLDLRSGDALRPPRPDRS
ncbi:hypothetical protein GCM10011517_20810 [Actibacterium pelagium]|uniref:N-acetyltransferase domain-containing protein n=2 Tax=Actibacterium pelagium TaxID=2029103 RepID=A0A917AHT0_9RHOB|nr:GNAT family N-acetyltransferase [Actibacterium pelagium]GGE52867.1 hypothetical protein GCM10011517_20810 [Actibacterium pelagium]